MFVCRNAAEHVNELQGGSGAGRRCRPVAWEGRGKLCENSPSLSGPSLFNVVLSATSSFVSDLAAWSVVSAVLLLTVSETTY